MNIPGFFPVIFIIQNIYLCDLSGLFMVLMVKACYPFLFLNMIACCYIKLLPLPKVHIYVAFLVSSLKDFFLHEDGMINACKYFKRLRPLIYCKT